MPRRSPRTHVARALLGCVAAYATNACGSDPRLVRPPRPSLLAGATGPQGYRSPAAWRYHPQQEAELNARVELGFGNALLAGARGERWLYDKKTGRVQAAASLAPEDLIAILKLDGGWSFIGKSGTSYEAREPLGPFVRSSAPFEPMVRVSAQAATMLGLRRDGGLSRSTDGGASWQAVGPAGTHFIDVALSSGRAGLALAVPEELWQTADAGATWKQAGVASFGAFEIIAEKSSGLVVRGVLGGRRWNPAGTPDFVPLDRDLVRSRYELQAEPARGPDAGALSEGRAAIVGDRYFEVLPRAKSPADWRLFEGPIDGRLISRSLPEVRGCHTLRLAGFGRWLYLACSRRSAASGAQAIELWRSEDSSRIFKIEPFSPDARPSEFTMAVGEGGALIVSGICPTHGGQSGCKAYGVHHRRLARPNRPSKSSDLKQPSGSELGTAQGPGKRPFALELAPSATPALKDTALALAFSADGRTAYAVGRRTKNNAHALFVSRDGGRTFAARDIEQVDAGTSDESEDDRWSARPATTPQTVETLRAADDGAVAIVFRRFASATLVVTDDEGRILSIANPPAEGTILGAAGTRALSLSPRTRQVWESLDAGATWDAIGRLPVDLCPGDSECSVPVYCHVGGCVIGDELSRVGWRGQIDGGEQGGLLIPQKLSADAFERRVRTPLSCSLDGAAWKRLDGVDSAPMADHAAIGKAVWFAVAVDRDRAAAWVLHAQGGARPHVERLTLLAPAMRPEMQAFYVSPQVEGAAALRYTVPESGPGETRLRDVEISWDNLFEGRVLHARLADGGEYNPGDYNRESSRAQTAHPALLSIAAGGIYLRLHKLLGDRQPTLFFDGRTPVVIAGVTWPTLAGKTTRSDMAHVGDSHVPLQFVGDGAALVRATTRGDAWAFDAYTTGLFDPKELELETYSDLTYMGTRAGLHVMFSDASGSRRSSMVFLLRASGAVVEAPIEVPMQLDAADRPSRCSPVQRNDTPRVVVPFQAGTRHPIVITDAAEPLRVLLTNRAVMHGTPAQPCVAAYDAQIVVLDDGANESERAILPLDDLEHAWLFRTLPDQRTNLPSVEYRSMSCRFDPGAEIPAEVYRATGTMIPRAR